MSILRASREYLPYLAMICCGLFVTSVYYFHDYRPSPAIPINQNDELKSLTPSSSLSQKSRFKNNTDLGVKETKHGRNKDIEDSLTTNKDVSSEVKHSYDKEHSILSKSGNSREMEHPLSDFGTSTSRFPETKVNSEKSKTNKTVSKFNLHRVVNITSWEMQNSFAGKSFNVSQNVDLLSKFLMTKLDNVTIRRIKYFRPTCNSKFKLANSCKKKCLQTELPENLSERVAQIVRPRSLQMTSNQHQILQEMADKVVTSTDIVLLTAASSNHFFESQALLENLHKNVFPHLANFSLIFYNLGLTQQERALMAKHCRCQVLDFPFHKFPHFMSTLKCYSWKPVIIKAHLNNANIVFWMDASIRFRNSPKHLYELIQTARQRGIQLGVSSADSAFRTYRSMYHFFGDEPCAYLKLGQARATFGVYHREAFVDRVILEPWVSCAVQENCMCPRDRSSLGCRDSKAMAVKYNRGQGPIVYGMCHRYDQSAISLILHKLYQDVYRWVMVDVQNVLNIRRRHTRVYFPKI